MRVREREREELDVDTENLSIHQALEGFVRDLQSRDMQVVSTGERITITDLE
jgi:hypothetical protein